jgi:hypothetical protein
MQAIQAIVAGKAVRQAVKTPKKLQPKKKLKQVVGEANKLKVPPSPLPVELTKKGKQGTLDFLYFYASKHHLKDSTKTKPFDFKFSERKGSIIVESKNFPSLSLTGEKGQNKATLVERICRTILEQDQDILAEFAEAQIPIQDKIQAYRDLPVKVITVVCV